MTRTANAASPGSSTPLPAGVVEALREALGPGAVLTGDDDLAAYERDWTGRLRGRAAAVLRPATTPAVAAAVRLCAEAGIGVVPQGGHTGLSGGATPDATGTQVVLSLRRLRRIRQVDPVGDTMTVEAGVVLADAQEAARAAGRLYPLTLASQGSATIGGTVATNAGGTTVLRYGMTRSLVLGLEVVLADGRVWDGLRSLRKDNSGYDLTGLFVGSEGTLGVITAATLRLVPPTPHVAIALVALPDIASAVALLAVARAAAGETLTAFELVSRAALEPVLTHLPGARDPFSHNHSWYGLVEVAGASPGVMEALERTLQQAEASGLVLDAVLSSAAGDRRAWWALREGVTEAERLSGPSLKHDISLPLDALADAEAALSSRLRAAVPGARVAPFGHVGDGGLHYNVGAPPGWSRDDWDRVTPELTDIVVQEVARRGGSISAEHGLGRTKREVAGGLKSDVELSLMRAVKQALDPQGLLNPGVLLPDGPRLDGPRLDG